MFLLDGVMAFLDGMLSTLPTLPPEILGALDGFTGVSIVVEVLAWVNWFLPLSTASVVIALWGTAMMAYLGIKMAIRYSEGIA